MILSLVYDSYALVVDQKDKVWIHEVATNRVVGFDHGLNSKVTFDGNGSFNIKKSLYTTNVLVLNCEKNRIYWHKGQGFLSLIDPLENTETILGDSISDTNHLHSIKITKNEQRLVALEGDYSTLQLYGIKKQKRIDTATYTNSQCKCPNHS